MRRRDHRSSPSPAGPGDQAVDDPPAGEQPNGTAGGDPEVWRETWEQSEEERVARWLESKTHRDPDTGDEGVRQAAAWRASAPDGREATSKPDREQYRRSLVAGIESARQEIEAHRRQEREARSVLEEEIRSLERQRRRLAADLELQEAEGDHVRREHLEVRGRLTAELEYLEVRRRELAGAVAQARAELDAARQDHDATLALLQAEIGALSEERAHVVAAVDAARIGAETARQADVDERNRLEQEIGALRAEERRLGDDAADREAPGSTPQGRGPGGPHVLDPSGKLAASVAELGRHLAAILERERAQAARRAAERRQVDALLESERATRAENGDLHPPAAGATRRRRRRVHER